MNIAFTLRAGQNIQQLLTDSHGRFLLLEHYLDGGTTYFEPKHYHEWEKDHPDGLSSDDTIDDLLSY
jgi:hypothetical protein